MAVGDAGEDNVIIGGRNVGGWGEVVSETSVFVKS
jgi:hypothetical protein